VFKRVFMISLAVIGSVLVAGAAWLRQGHRFWGVDSDDAARELPGDDLVADPGIVETRSLVIDAPPAAVWPWLAQMGYGRGGWYSYDQLDNEGPSADEIMPEFQDLAVDDLVPTHEDGGFIARVVDRGRALVLYMDTKTVTDRPTQASEDGEATQDDATPAGLRMAGAMGEATMPDFKGSWAFVLEPEPEGRTRLIERFRVWAGDSGFAQQVGMPFMGYAVFLMTRKQMLGIKQRAEAGREATPATSKTPLAEPSPA